jgi:hypothetical protein
MADIIDRLISRVEFQGVSTATDQLMRLVKGHKTLETAMDAVNNASVAASRAQSAAAANMQRTQAATSAAIIAANRRVAQTTRRMAQLQVQYEVAGSSRFPGMDRNAYNASLDKQARIRDSAMPMAFAQQQAAIAASQAAHKNAGVQFAAAQKDGIKQVTVAQKALNQATEEYDEMLANRAAGRAALGVAAAVMAATAVGQFGVAVAKTAIEFERFENQLEVLYRSKEQGKQALDWIVQFAKTTPFSVASATEAFVRLNALGIAPTRRNLMAMGGLAKMFNRDFSDVAMAVGIGASGNFARLIRGFGITRADVAQNAGPGVIPAHGPITQFDKAQKAIIETFEKKFPRAMEIFRNSAEVAISNMMDSWEQFKRAAAGPSGAQNIAKSAYGMQVFIDYMTQGMRLLQIGGLLFLTTVNLILRAIMAVANILPMPANFRAVFDNVREGMKRGDEARVKSMQDIAYDYMNAFNGVKTDPPKPPLGTKPGQDAANTMANAIRQIVGQSGIAQIGVNASELPGIGNPMKKPPLKVEVSGSNGSNFNQLVEEILNKFLYDANRHGYSMSNG